MSKPAKTGAFLAALFDGCEGLIEVRAIPVSKDEGGSIHRAFFSRDAIPDVLDWCRQRLGGDDGLYVAVATRQSDASGALANCLHLPALFADLDFKDNSEGKVRTRLEGFSLQPSIVVQSGHGLHVYWLLKEPIDLVEDAAEAGQLLRRLAAHLQGDPASAEPARVLRIPGTYNRKDTPAVRVVTECFDLERRYTTFDVNEALPEVTEHAVISTTAPLSSGGPIPKGRRNPELYSRGRKIKAAGLSPAAIEAALRAEVCEPPLPPAELDAVIRQVLTQKDRADYQGGGGADVILDTASRQGRAPAWPKPLKPAAFHRVFGDFVRLVEPETEADPAALLLTALVAFGNVIGRQAYFDVGSARHYLNLFVLLVGATSKARKGTSLRDIFRFFRQVDETWVTTRVLSGLSSGEGLIWSIHDPIEKQKSFREKGQTVYETIVEDPGVEDKRVLIVESEFASTLKVMRREGNTLSPTIRQAWDGGILRTLTKNSPAQATEGHVSILGHITSAELWFGGTESSNGFANRFLFACVRRANVLPEGGCLGEEKVAAIADVLAASVARLPVRGSPLALQRDDEARALWAETYKALSGGHPGLLGYVTARAEAQVTRLACLYALGDQSAVVRVEHLRAALAVWRFSFESARYQFGDRTGNPVADKIREALQGAGTQGLTRTEISKLLQGHCDTGETDTALGLLDDHGLAKQEIDRSKPGRPPERWFDVPDPDTGERSERSPATGVSSLLSRPAQEHEPGVISHSSLLSQVARDDHGQDSPTVPEPVGDGAEHADAKPDDDEVWEVPS